MASSLTAQTEMLRFQNAFARVDAFVQQTMQTHKTPGMAVALTAGSGLLRLSTHGFSDLKRREPVEPDTLFGIGSIGKSFTAVAILQLHQDGKLALHAPVEDYLSWFRVHSSVPITTHHLLTHTAGIPGIRMEVMSSLFQGFWLAQIKKRFVPDSKYHYSSSAYDVLSTLISELAGQPYGDFIRQRILTPLGMNQSEPVFQHAMRPRLACSYEPLFDDRPSHSDYPLFESSWYEYGGGAGSIASTAGDLAVYLRMLLNRGAGPKARVLSEQSFNLLIQPTVEQGENRFYGYAIQVTEEKGHTVIGHGGGVQGFRSMMLGDLEDRLGVVVLANGPTDRGVARFALETLRAALHQEAFPEIPSWQPPTYLTNAGDFAGTYTDPDGRSLRFRAADKKLVLDYGAESVVLEQRGPDRFLARHPNFDLFLLEFHRAEDEVVELFHGSDWYVNERYNGSHEMDHPKQWATYPGHYRTSTRHHVNFRVVLRKGRLFLVHPSGQTVPLTPLEDGSFQLGDTPEWIQFDSIVNGRALRANYSGSDFYRNFRP